MSQLLASHFPLVLAAGLFAIVLAAGAAPERLLSGTLLGIVGSDRLCDAWLEESTTQAVPWAYLAIDMLGFGVIIVVAIKANRIYPLWLGAAQIMRLVSDLWRTGLTDPIPRVHQLTENAIFDVELAVMIVGLAFHVRRRQVLGSDYSAWSR